MESLFGTTYDNFEAAREAINAYTNLNPTGYNLAIHKSKPNATAPKRTVYMRCAKGRVYSESPKPPSSTSRRSSTQMTGCPYRVTIRINYGPCTIVGNPSEKASKHNHPRFDNPVSSHFRKKVLEDNMERILFLSRSSYRPRGIFETLQREKVPGIDALTIRHIAQAVRKHKQEQLTEQPEDEEPGDVQTEDT